MTWFVLCVYWEIFPENISKLNVSTSTLGNSPPSLLNLELLRPQGQIIDVKCKKSQCIFQTESSFYEAKSTYFTLFFIKPHPADHGKWLRHFDSADRGICHVYVW